MKVTLSFLLGKIRYDVCNLRSVSARQAEEIGMTEGIIADFRDNRGRFAGLIRLSYRDISYVDGLTAQQLDAIANPTQHHAKQDKEVQSFLF